MERTTTKPQLGRVLVNADNVSFSSPERRLFKGCSFNVRERESVALTGSSGTGKSVLLKIISGKLQPEAGTVEVPKNIRTSYVPQHIGELNVAEGATVGELFMRARGLDQLERRKAELERNLAVGDSDNLKLLDQYQEAEDKYEARGGYRAESEAAEILAGLRCDARTGWHINLGTKVNEVSSGQHTRLLIGQALFARPDLLILDDPTSHLDKESVRWFSDALRSPANAALVVTTDSAFIDRFASKVVEITQTGRVFSFSGSYNEFVEKRDQTLAAEEVAARSRQQDIAKLEESVQDFKAKGYVRRSGVMARRVGTIETRIEQARKELAQLPSVDTPKRSDRYTPQQFEILRRSGEDVLAIHGIQKSYRGRVAIDLPDWKFELRRGETTLIAGKNGSGKSTLMRMIAAVAGFGSFPPDAGSIVLGQSLVTSYYAPDREGVSGSGRVFEEARAAMQTPNEGKLRSVLSFWGFDATEIQRKGIEELSKGEHTQLALAKMMLRRPNFMLLDEPANNLSTELIRRFVESLRGYTGTLMIISHNSEFVDQLKVSKVINMPDGRVAHQ